MVQVLEAFEVPPEKLRKARQWAGFTSRGLSEQLGMYPHFVSKIETGQIESISRDLLERIAELLAGRSQLANVTKQDLIGYFLGERNLDDTIRPFDLTPRKAGVVPDGPSMTAAA